MPWQYQVKVHAWVFNDQSCTFTCNADDRGWYIEKMMQAAGAPAMFLISTTPYQETGHIVEGDLNLVVISAEEYFFYLPSDISKPEIPL